jgi:hypothetical protein
MVSFALILIKGWRRCWRRAGVVGVVKGLFSSGRGQGGQDKRNVQGIITPIDPTDGILIDPTVLKKHCTYTVCR